MYTIIVCFKDKYQFHKVNKKKKNLSLGKKKKKKVKLM
jgi:hypothetical protein